jgi:hypothetical protein
VDRVANAVSATVYGLRGEDFFEDGKTKKKRKATELQAI